MGKKKNKSVLEGAMNAPTVLMGDPLGQAAKSTSALITVPMAIVGCTAVIFGLVKLVKFAWFF